MGSLQIGQNFLPIVKHYKLLFFPFELIRNHRLFERNMQQDRINIMVMVMDGLNFWKLLKIKTDAYRHHFQHHHLDGPIASFKQRLSNNFTAHIASLPLIPDGICLSSLFKLWSILLLQISVLQSDVATSFLVWKNWWCKQFILLLKDDCFNKFYTPFSLWSTKL